MKRTLCQATGFVILLGALLVVSATGATARADDPVQSHWRTDDLRIDGVMTDWPEQTFVSKEVSASVANDAQDLYILVATSDSAVNLQLTRAGLSVYLDPKGGKGLGFGIRIPPLGNRLEPANAPRGGADEPPLLSYFDVLGPGDEIRRVELEDGTGIDLRIGSSDGTFFMELKVPFATAAGRPYAPGITLAKGEFGLGIVTPDPQRVARPQSSGRGGGFGGMGGGAGMPPQPKGKALNIWTKVVLAKGR
jgi:hypothetical protein